jgi:hypothetical protein
MQSQVERSAVLKSAFCQFQRSATEAVLGRRSVSVSTKDSLMTKQSPLRIMQPASKSPPPLDSSDLGPLHIVPLVPDEILTRHKVRVSTDTRFRAAARLLQSLWRADRDLPIGSYVDATGKRVRLGSRITDLAGRQGANFLTPEIAALVRRECVYRELGAMIEIDRLRANLLSSMPLTFNFFAPLKQNLPQAARFINELLPGVMHRLLALRFEHAPARGKQAYTGDYSAFDFAIRGESSSGQRVMIAFEMKYSEGFGEPSPSRINDRQLALAQTSGLYREAEDPTLFSFGLQQLTRELNLAQSMLDRGDVDIAIFVLASPRLNHLTQLMGETFGSKLNPPSASRASFISITLETMLEAFVGIGMVSHAQALHRRYLDFQLVDGELELDAAEMQQADQTASSLSLEDEPNAVAS